MAKAKEKGTLIRGADGALYYIPDKELQAYRVPDEHAAEARSYLDQQMIVARGGACPAFYGEDLVSRVAEIKALNLDVLRGIARKK